jgi:hypothetical protein
MEGDNIPRIVIQRDRVRVEVFVSRVERCAATDTLWFERGWGRSTADFRLVIGRFSVERCLGK